MCLSAVTGASGQVIEVATKDLSLVLTVDGTGQVLFQHFGSRITDPELFLQKATYRHADHGTDNLAYGTAGGRNFRSPALRVTQADGDLNTELRYVSHRVKRPGDDVVETTVVTEDPKTGLVVKLVYTAYGEENVILSHSEIENRTDGPVVLHEFYSSALPLRASKYLLTHFYGSWAREMQVDHTLLTHGIKSIESRKGVRTTHTENPSFLLSLDTESFDENYGEVIAGALAWSGNFRLVAAVAAAFSARADDYGCLCGGDLRYGKSASAGFDCDGRCGRNSVFVSVLRACFGWLHAEDDGRI